MAQHYRSSPWRLWLIRHGPCILAATIGAGIALVLIAAIVVPSLREN